MNNELKKVIIVGGSGFIGGKLSEDLLSRGYTIAIADIIPPRITHERLSFVKINFVKDTVDPSLFEGVYGVVNLAGATIGKRWNEEYQNLIYSSRIVTTKAIVEAISSTTVKPKVLVSASAVGYYGDRKNHILVEGDASGTDFLAKVCVDWEAEALKVERSGVRLSIIRTAHVLGPGGLLSTLAPLFKFGFGGYFGKGSQYMPWIHYKDIVGVYAFALEQPIDGPINVGAGIPTTQKELFKEFAFAIGAPLPFLFRIPKFFAWVALGDFADSLFMSQNTDSSKIRKLGYHYQYEDLDTALSDLFEKS